MSDASTGSLHFPSIKGYRVVEVLSDAGRSRVFRARRESDGSAVVLKCAGVGADPSAERRRLERELALTRRTASEYVIRALGVERRDEQSALVLEDIGAESLDSFRRRRRLEVVEVLRIGAKVARGLASIHSNGLIHRDINPSNILYDPASGGTKIIDFDIAMEQDESDGTDTVDWSAAEGSLPYISPEQTGRTQRPLD